jgi:hypothetical protein
LGYQNQTQKVLFFFENYARLIFCQGQFRFDESGLGHQSLVMSQESKNQLKKQTKNKTQK